MAQTMKETPAEEKPAQKYLSLKELPKEDTPKKEELKIEARQETAKKPNIEELKDALKKILGTG